MKKRLLSVILVASLLLSFVSAFSLTVNATCSSGIKNNGLDGLWIDINSDPYTYFEEKPYGGYAYGTEGCAWFASARSYQITGEDCVISSGYSWYEGGRWDWYGYSIGQECRAKSLACYSGHVIVIEKVVGNDVLISEGGSGYSDYLHGYCVIRWTTINAIENNDFLGYVYLKPDFTPSTYSFKVNGSLDGSDFNDLGNYGTFDVYINDQLSDDVNYFGQDSLPAGSTYLITDIKPKNGKGYLGLKSGSRSGTLNGDTNVRLSFYTPDPADYIKKHPVPAKSGKYKGHTYYYYDSPVSWYDANAVSEYLGGHLVTISDGVENNFAWELAGKSSVWTGATDRNKEGNWQWANGESFSHSAWNSGEPNNSSWGDEGTENYGHITDGGGWNDAGGYTCLPFICEFDRIPAESIVLNKSSETLVKGKTFELKAEVLPEDSTETVTWSSSDASVASVNAEGTVLGVSEGTATITASIGDTKASCKVTVVSDPYIITSELPDAVQYKEYSVQLSALGNGELIWTIKSGSLPNGLKLDKNTGVISGRPKQSGIFTFTVKLTGSAGAYTRSFSLSVAENEKEIYIADEKCQYSGETAIDLQFTVSNETDDVRDAYIAVAEYNANGEVLTCRAKRDLTVNAGYTQVKLPLVLSAPDNSIKVFILEKGTDERLCEAIAVNYASGWIAAEDLPEGVTASDEKWTYTLTEKKDSSQSVLEGWTKTGEDWIKTSETGTYYYVNIPSGFDRSHNLYSKYNHSAYSPSSGNDNGTEWKTEVVSTTQSGYIYWHWTHNQYELPNGNYNVIISDEYCWDDGREYYNFRAFESTTDYGHTDPNGNSSNVYYAWFGDPIDGSWWWYRFPVYKQTYVKKTKQYHFERISNLESGSEVLPGEGISDITYWVKYKEDVMLVSDVAVPDVDFSYIDLDIKRGDANGDGEVDAIDAAMTLKYDAGLIELTTEQLASLDVNGDDEVDAIDAALILKYDAGMIDEL